MEKVADAQGQLQGGDRRGSYFKQGTEAFGPNSVPTTSRQTSATHAKIKRGKLQELRVGMFGDRATLEGAKRFWKFLLL